MGRFTLILVGIWGAFALLQSSDIDRQTLFWAALLPTTYFVGMMFLSDREEP